MDVLHPRPQGDAVAAGQIAVPVLVQAIGDKLRRQRFSEFRRLIQTDEHPDELRQRGQREADGNSRAAELHQDVALKGSAARARHGVSRVDHIGVEVLVEGHPLRQGLAAQIRPDRKRLEVDNGLPRHARGVAL